MAYAKFKTHKFSYLNITSIGSDYVLKGSECGLACVNIPSCFSFNLGAFRDVIGKVICELLPSDIYNNSEKFVRVIIIIVSQWVETRYSHIIYQRIEFFFLGGGGGGGCNLLLDLAS